MKKTRIVLTCVFVLSLLLSACGGGDKDSSSSQSQTDEEITKTGVIVDSQIYGLRYKSIGPDGEEVEGLTNTKGEYQYFDGGTTTFLVGGIEIAKTTPKKMISITTLVDTPTEQENLARFLQTLDTDKNPDNGIQINATAINAINVKELKFDNTFDSNFENIKENLFDTDSLNTLSLVSKEAAVEHSAKSQRLSALQETDLYKAIANEKTYNSPYYNTDVFVNDQRKRVYLWIWEKILAKEMAMENDLATQEFDINKVEQERDRYKKYLDYADSLVSISSLGSGAYEQLSKAGTRTMSYELTHLTSLTASGCDAVVKLTNADSNDSVTLSDDDICKNMMKVLNPVGDSTSKLAVANPILSGFLPEALPIIMRYKKMNWLHFDTKTIRSLSKVHVSKPSLVSLGISMAGIFNDSAGAYRASNINRELTTRLVAQEWLSIWFRSGFKQEYMNQLINNNSTKLKGNREQIEAIALKFGNSSAYCDAKKFFNPFVDCSGKKNINYDYQKVADIINEKLTKSNALYKNLGSLTGSMSNDTGEIGVISIGWVKDENLTDIGEPIRLSGKLSITEIDGTLNSSVPEDIKVRFAQCNMGDDGGAGYMYALHNSPSSVESDGSFLVELNPMNFSEDDAVECNATRFFGVYGFQFYRDINDNGTIDDEDIYVGDWTTNSRVDNQFHSVHIKMENQSVNIQNYTFAGDEFISVMANYTNGGGGSKGYKVAKIENGMFSLEKYINNDDFHYKYDDKLVENFDYLDYYIFSSDKASFYDNQADDALEEGSFIAISEDITQLTELKKSTIYLRLKKNNQIDGTTMNASLSEDKLKIENGNFTITSRCTKKVYISNDNMSSLDTSNINDIYSRTWQFIHSGNSNDDNYNCTIATEDDSSKTMSCETDARGDNFRALITEGCEAKWTITDTFNMNAE